MPSFLQAVSPSDSPTFAVCCLLTALSPSQDALLTFLLCLLRAAQRRGMFIQMQPTPNPASMMFLPGQAVMEVRRVAGCVARIRSS